MGLVDRAAEAETEALLQKAQEAVQAGDWSAAKEGFEAALARGEAGEALFGLGIALQWLGDVRVRDPSLGAGVRGLSPASRCAAGRARCVLPLPRLPHDPRQRGRLPRLV